MESIYSDDYLLNDALFLSIFLAILGIYSAIFILTYILQSIALYTLANNNGMSEKKIYGWIPILNSYLIYRLGEAGNERYNPNIKTWAIVYALSGILASLINIFTGVIGTLGVFVWSQIVMYRLTKRITGENNLILFTVLNVITLGLFFTFYIFIKRKVVYVEEGTRNEMENANNPYANPYANTYVNQYAEPKADETLRKEDSGISGFDSIQLQKKDEWEQEEMEREREREEELEREEREREEEREERERDREERER